MKKYSYFWLVEKTIYLGLNILANEWKLILETSTSQENSSLSDKLKENLISYFKQRLLKIVSVMKYLPARLKTLKLALLSIKPSSVEPERSFSSASYFLSKIRSALSDNSSWCFSHFARICAEKMFHKSFFWIKFAPFLFLIIMVDVFTLFIEYFTIFHF
jgi:hypothetical protein